MNRRLNILISMPTNEYSERMKLEGILQYAHEKKGVRWDLELDLSGILRRLASSTSPSAYDGIIAYVGSDSERRSLLAIRQPLVLIEDLTIPAAFPRRKDIVTILCDHAAEGETAAGYFLERNYRNFAYVGAEEDSEYNALRRKGYAAALANAGFRVSTYDGKIPLASWLKGLPRPCALLAVHDLRAREVLTAAEQAKIPVPAELAVLGVDDDEVLCLPCRPALSSIRPPHEELGRFVAAELDRLMRGKPARPEITIKGNGLIVARTSTQNVPPAGALVARALAFIDAHATEPLEVSDIVRYLGVSRRLADLRFRQIRNASIKAAIDAARLKAVKKRLNASSEPITRIAADLGFSSPEHLAHFFRHQTGLSMCEFRK